MPTKDSMDCVLDCSLLNFVGQVDQFLLVLSTFFTVTLWKPTSLRPKANFMHFEVNQSWQLVSNDDGKSCGSSALPAFIWCPVVWLNAPHSCFRRLFTHYIQWARLMSGVRLHFGELKHSFEFLKRWHLFKFMYYISRSSSHSIIHIIITSRSCHRQRFTIYHTRPNLGWIL